jgi:hypothetical protein
MGGSFSLGSDHFIMGEEAGGRQMGRMSFLAVEGREAALPVLFRRELENDLTWDGDSITNGANVQVLARAEKGIPCESGTGPPLLSGTKAA